MFFAVENCFDGVVDTTKVWGLDLSHVASFVVAEVDNVFQSVAPFVSYQLNIDAASVNFFSQAFEAEHLFFSFACIHWAFDSQVEWFSSFFELCQVVCHCFEVVIAKCLTDGSVYVNVEDWSVGIICAQFEDTISQPANVLFEFEGNKKIAKAIECKVNGVEKGIVLTENDFVFVTNGSCTEGTIYGDQNHAPNGDAEVRTSGCWSLWKNIAKQDPSFGHPEKFCSDIAKTNWESATVTTLDDKIIPYITDICKRDPRTGKVVTGGIVSCQDSSWLLSWTINRQGQFKDQDKDKVCVWVYGLFTDVPGDYIKKPMKECTGKEITEEWLYHLGVPVDQIEDMAENSAVCVPTMMPYITAFFMPRTKGDRPDVIPDGCVNFAFLGQFADTPRDTVFTTEYSVRTAMEAVYGLLGVDRGVPEVWGSVYDIRELLDSSVKLMDGKSPLEIELPGPLDMLKKPLLKVVKGTVIEKVLRDHDVIKDYMM